MGMQIGLIGVGVVGGTLKDYFQKNSDHTLKLYDPVKGYNDDLTGCKAIFISIPVEPNHIGQDTRALENCVTFAKKFTEHVFIRSTVLPGTNDRLGTTSMPEFLTERNAYEEMLRLPILAGTSNSTHLLKQIFPYKIISVMTNKEAETAKLAHNCFGAFKVTYFNLLKKFCEETNQDFLAVKQGMALSGFIDIKNHAQVPGPDGQKGYGGKCFPSNMQAMWRMFSQMPHFELEAHLFKVLQDMNFDYRHMPVNRKEFDADAL